MNPLAGWKNVADPTTVHAAAFDAYEHEPSGAQVYRLWRADAGNGISQWCWRLVYGRWTTEFSSKSDIAPPWRLLNRELKDMQNRVVA